MSRPDPMRSSRGAGSRRPHPRRFRKLTIEPLEDRLMLAAAIVVGRTLATPATAGTGAPLPSYFVGEVQNNQVTITYTVYNEQADTETGVLLTTTLEPGVTLLGSSVTLDGTTTAQLPDQSGQNLGWSLQPIQGYDRESVAVTVGLPSPTPLQLDTVAHVSATLDAGAVSATTPAATLQAGNVSNPALLASTLDANTTDPYVQEEAAALNYNPTQIFSFLQTQIGYESYTGSLRGARGTLWSAAGNALDVASLGVALMRASGIPAQYVQGTLPENLAQQLILSMFPQPTTVVGYVSPGTQVADPANDPELLAETEDHYWFEFDTGSGFQNADPLIPGSAIGRSFTTQAGTFTEVPDSLEQKVEVKLSAEITDTADGLFGLPGQQTTTVLDFTFDSDDLVGKPLTLGNFVTQSGVSALFTSVTNTYTPYLTMGDYDAPASKDTILEGQSYQEVLTSFPFGSQVLTGVFLDIVTSGPNQPTQTYERTLADRIGYVARQTGGPSSLNVQPTSQPLLTDLDLFTINVVTGLITPQFPGRLPQTLVQAQVPQPTGAQGTAAYNAQVSADLTAERSAVTNLNQAFAGYFMALSDNVTTKLAAENLVKAYFTSPQVVITATRVGQDATTLQPTLVHSIDLSTDSITVLAFPGQAQSAAVAFNALRGVSESFAEQEAITDLDPDDSVGLGAASIVQAAMDQNIPLTAITSQNLSSLDALDISAEAKARISAAIQAGESVIVPTRSVVVDGLTSIAWYEVNPTTGETIGVGEDGGHEFFDNAAIYGAIGYLSGFLLFTAAIDCVFAVANGVNCLTSAGSYLQNKPFKNSFADQLAFGFGKILSALGHFFDPPAGPPIPSPSASNDTFAQQLATILQVPNLNIATPSQLGAYLLDPGPSGLFGSLTGSQIATAVVPDPRYTLPFDGALLPTAFLAGIKNLGSTTATYNLSTTNVPAGFTAVTSLSQVTIPAGETAEIGFYLIPSGAIPAPGTSESFKVTATSNSNSQITQTQTETFTVPAIDAITITVSPASVNTTPGVAATDTLTITNVGNVPENDITLSDTSTTGLALSGLAPLSLAAGQSKTEAVILTPDASTPLNSIPQSTITATYGPSGSTQTLILSVNVVVPGAQAIGNAATAATQLGDSDLASRLGDLSTAITNLVQNPSSPIYRSQSVADVNAIALLIGADAFLAPLATTLTTDGDTLSQAATASALQSTLTTLSNDLATVNTTLNDEIQHNFTLSLLTNSQTAQPQTPLPFQIVLQNTGSATTTYDLSISGLPSGVTAVFSQPSITLGAGQVTPGTGEPDVTVTLTSTSSTAIPAFTFQVTATAEGVSEITRTTTGSLTSRAALVQVVSVTPNPTFTQPGGQVDVSARILNAVNKEQQAEVSYTVMDSTGNVVFTSTPVTTTLQVLTTLSTVDLGNLDTTGFADGDDTIKVTVADASGNPITGATGQGSLLIGSPVTSTLTENTDQLPPGNGTVTDTLQVGLNPAVVSSSNLVGQIQPPNGATTVASYGNYAYVGGNSGISIVDVSNPASPTVVKTFGASDLASGYVPYVTVSGSYLYVNSSNPNGNPVSSLLIYSLADPLNPVLQGQVPLGNNYLFRGIAPYIDTTDQHAYMNSFWVRYYISGGEIFEQHGEIVSVDISNPADPTVDGVVFNLPPSSNYSDGDSNIWQESAVNSDTLLAATTTNTGSTLNGTGEVMVIDTTNPSSPTVSGYVPVPGTVSLIGIAQESGNRAIALGTTGYWSPGPDVNLTGNLVLTTLDETNPDNPKIIATVPLNLPSQSAATLIPLGNDRFMTTSQSPSTGQEDVVIIDTTDPNNPVVSTFPVPTTLNGASVSGNLLYTTSSSGLLIYNLNALTATTPVTAQVTVPINSIVPNSYNVAPTTIISGATTETLEWDLSLSQAQTGQTFTWQSAVSNLEPGQLQSVAQGGTVQFTSAGSNGTLTLPPLAVTGQQILGLDPATQTVAPGQAASYTLDVDNPTSSAVTYDLALEGVPSSWSNLPATVTVAAGGEQDLPFTLTSDAFTPTADFGFTVTATAGTTAGSVTGDLVLAGSPVQPDADSQGIVASLTPASATAGQGTSAFYTVSLVNTGSSTETYALTAALPPGFTVDLAQTTVTVPPGASNFRDVALMVTTLAGTSPGTVPISIIAVATTHPSVSSTASGTLNVSSSGVKVALNPPSAVPGSPYELTVTNTGTASDTFNLALAGPAAMVSKLANTAVTLAPGATQVISISTTAVDFALPGSLDLTAIATSRNSPDVMQGASANLAIPSITGMSAQFSPATMTVAAPGTTTFLLQVNNTGNSEDQYSATIIGTTGPVTASLVGLDGLPTQSIALFRLPALSTGALALQANLTGPGQGTVTVLVKSLSTGQETTIVASIADQYSSTDGPKITLVQRYGIHMMKTTIVLTFNQPLDPTRAQDVHEYHIIDPQGHAVPIKSAVYDPLTNTVTLYPKYRINLHHRYKLTVNGASPSGLTGSSGLLLDGKSSGKPGSNYVATINWRDVVLPPNYNPKWLHLTGPDKNRESVKKPAAAVITGHIGLFQRSSTLVKHGSAKVAKASVVTPLHRPTAPGRRQESKRSH